MLLFCNFEFYVFFSEYLWASWFDRGVAIGGLFPLTFKSLIFPPDIDTPGLVERYGNWVVYAQNSKLLYAQNSKWQLDPHTPRK